MSDFKKIIVSVTSKMSFQVVSILIVFFLTPFMIKKLGDNHYGLWILTSIFVNYMGYAELGITGAIERNLAVAFGEKNFPEVNRVFNTGLFLNFIILLMVSIITIITFFIIGYLNFKNNNLIACLVAIMGFNLALTFPFRTFSNIISANIRFEIISGIQVFQITSNAILTYFLLNQGFGIVSLAICALVTVLSSNLITLFYVLKTSDYLEFKISFINKLTIKKLMTYSGKSFLVQIAEILRMKLDEVVTAMFISVNMVTIYSVANRLNSTANNFSLSFLSVINPLFSKNTNIKNDKEKASIFFMISKVSITMALLFFFGFLFLGYPFINIWMGKNYLLAFYPLIILALAYCIAYTQSASVSYMYSAEKQHYFAYISIIEGVLNLLLSIFLVVKFHLGIIGVALGTLIPLCLMKFFIQPYIVSGILKIKTLDYYIFFAKCILAGVLIYLPVGFLVLKFSLQSYFEIALVAFMFLIVAICHFLVILNNSERTFLFDKVVTKLDAIKNERVNPL